MIEIHNITKKFGKFTALNDVSSTIGEGSIYGLVGSNGAGKSTFLRLLTGVYKADEGEILYDGTPVYNNPEIKEQIIYVSDELMFLGASNMKRMANFYASLYNNFDYTYFNKLVELFGLDPKASISSFSKGMKRQAAIILALCTHPKYMFFDETFDGLDPVMRNLVKKLIFDEVMKYQSTAIIASHSLRELEDLCDQLSLLHKGGLVFEKDVNSLKTTLVKVQIAFKDDFDKTKFSDYELLHFSKQGSVASLIMRGDIKEISASLEKFSPLLLETLPLTLEEIFTYEMEALGYHFDEKLEVLNNEQN